MREVINECDVPVQILHECFVVDVETGILTWKHRPISHFNSRHGYNVFNSRYCGKAAGCPDANGHLRVRIGLNGKTGTFFSHRVIWAMAYGDWPQSQIDHKNTIKSDNRLNNLRKATNSQNMANRGPQSNNTSGAPGVHFLKRTGRYQAHIKHNGKRKHLGYYSTFDEAKSVRDKAASELFGEYKWQ